MGAETLGVLDPYYRRVLQDGARAAILAFLNAALEAGVAREMTPGQIATGTWVSANCLLLKTGESTG